VRMEHISKIVSRVLHKKPVSKQRPGQIIDWEREWVRAAGEAGEESFPLQIKNGIMTVRVVHSSWMMELKRREKEIRKELEQNTGVSLSKIRFTR